MSLQQREVIGNACERDTPMKIKSFEVRLLTVDSTDYYRRLFIDVPRTWHWPLLIARTDEGLEGYSTCYWPRGEGPGMTRVLRDFYAQDLIGLSLDDHHKWWEMAMARQRHIYGLSDGMVGILDVLLWDLRGKAANLSVAALLGGAMRTQLPCYQTSQNARMTPEQVFADVKQVMASGMRGYKLQMWEGPEKDIPRLRAAREAGGESFPLMFDAVAGYDFEQAMIVGRELDRLNYTWFEEPIPDRQFRQLRQLARAINTPVLTGETLRLQESPEAIRQGVGDRFRGDVHIKSGVTGMRQLIAMCELNGVDLEVHMAVNPMMDLANLHLACSTKLGHFFEVHSPEARQGMVGDPLAPDLQGNVHLPTGPGLGAQLDWNWIDNHTVNMSIWAS